MFRLMPEPECNEPKPPPESPTPHEQPATTRAPRQLPDLATRIQEAQDQARQRRVEQGLPADADDGGYMPRKARKHAAKRSKKHGQFLGTVCDSWEATRRR
jgi:hypothetical protein